MNSYDERVKAAIAVIREQQEAITDLTHENQEKDGIIAQAIAGLLPIPIEGEEWDGSLNYITGTVATWSGLSYITLKYSRGKQPDISPEHWEVYELPADALYWAELESGHAFNLGDRVEHNGTIWACIKAHAKSQVRVPLVGSQWWETVE